MSDTSNENNADRAREEAKRPDGVVRMDVAYISLPDMIPLPRILAIMAHAEALEAWCLAEIKCLDTAKDLAVRAYAVQRAVSASIHAIACDRAASSEELDYTDLEAALEDRESKHAMQEHTDLIASLLDGAKL